MSSFINQKYIYIYIMPYNSRATHVVCWLSGKILSLTLSWVGFDHSLKRPTCLATLKSCDTMKHYFCG